MARSLCLPDQSPSLVRRPRQLGKAPVPAQVIVTVDGARVAMEVSPDVPMDVYEGAEHRRCIHGRAGVSVAVGE